MFDRHLVGARVIGLYLVPNSYLGFGRLMFRVRNSLVFVRASSVSQISFHQYFKH